MDSLELQALAAVDGHQPDRIHVQSAGRDLPQVALLGEEHELADPVQASAEWGGPPRWGPARE